MINFFKHNLLWKDGKYIAFSTTFVFLFFFVFCKQLLIFPFSFFIFSLYFFRNPNRFCNNYEKSFLISPSDGKVVEIGLSNIRSYEKKISIFLSPLDVHVNWLPIDGTIKEIKYSPGKFAVAFAPKSSEINERNDLIIENNNGNRILVRQIAGFVARRICCWAKEGDISIAGKKYGMIRFGSRIDLFLPKNVEIYVAIGDRLKGGESIIGRFL